MPEYQNESKIEMLWDKFWLDKNGDYVIWQWPNAWLIGWALATVVSLMTKAKVSDVFSLIGTASLIVWSGLEIISGVNYFRRALGLVVMVFSVMMVIKVL
jgi:hypothetical protein